ncbi:bacteriohemerythrin [bacterium]|nr:bacteriohemerythrin [bacterium]
MALLTWNEKLSVQVGQFDREHQELVNLINKLHDAMKAGQGKQVVGDVLKALISYTKNHFAAEERLMKAHGYPAYENHKKEHNQLTLTVLDFQKGYLDGSVPLSQTVMNFLKDWLTGHIQGVDKEYGPFLNGKGIR